MATYAIGDIHGCSGALFRLLDAIAFDPARDRLWLTGDLVGRGRGSLDVLRWARGLGDACVTVLGNHDLALLAAARGGRRRRDSSFLPVLAASDAEELLGWLAARPFVYREGERLLVHAGLLPSWSASDAEALSAELSSTLARDPSSVLTLTSGEAAPRWRDDLVGSERARTLCGIFTRLRVCDAEGRYDLAFTGAPANAPAGLAPWFAAPARKSAEVTVVFGHWALLGLHRAPKLLGVDSGCVWGGALTAVCLEDGRATHASAG